MKAVIFDLDGTILDTLDDLADATNEALKQSDLPTRTVDEVRNFVGNGIYKLIERAVPAGTEKDVIDKVFTDFKVYYGEHCADKTKPYTGIIEVLTNLKQMGCKLAVVSNKADFAVKQLCEQYFPNVFDVTVGERKGVLRKPAPDSVEEVLRQLQLSKDETVYIGDSEVDIQTAKNADMKCITVCWGFRNKEFLIAQGAMLLADQPRQIELLLQENM